MRGTPRLTGRGVIALAMVPVSTVIGLVLGAEELILLAIALASFAAIGFIQCAARLRRAKDGWRISVRLEATDIPRGHASNVVIDLTAVGRAGAVPVRLEDPKSGWEDITGGGAQGGSSRPTLPSPALTVSSPALVDGGSAALRFPVPTEQRGVFQLRSARLWCFDGMALFAGLVATGPSATVTVLPVPSEVELNVPRWQGDAEDEQIELLTPRPPSRQYNMGDFAGLRAYVPGDRLRLLYWPALARGGELLVRDFEDTGSRRLHLLADVRSHLGWRGTESVLSTAAGAGLAALAAGSIVEFSTTGGHSVAIGPGPYGDLALLRAIAAVAIAPPPERHRRLASHPHVSAHSVETFARADVVITTPGGANSLPAALQHGHLVIAR